MKSNVSRRVTALVLGILLVQVSIVRSDAAIETENDVVEADQMALADLGRFRSDLGLSSQPDYLAALVRDPKSVGAIERISMFGLQLTDEEATDLQKYLEFLQLIEQIGPVLEAQFAEVFGGSFVEPGADGGGQFTFLVTDHRDEVIGVVRERLGEEVLGRVKVKTSRFSQRYLVSTAEVINSLLNSRDAEALPVSVNARSNQVEFSAPPGLPLPDGVQDLVSASVATQVPFEGYLQTTASLKNQPLPYAVIEGGQVLTDYLGGQADCTSGFAVVSALGQYLMTADHCAPLNYVFFQGGFRAGPELASSLGSGIQSTDASLISLNGNRNGRSYVHATSTFDYVPVHFITPGDQVGFPVCTNGHASTGLDGTASNRKCGVITSVASCGAVGFPGCNFRRADYRTCGGDSGSAIYRDTAFGRAAEGIQHGAVVMFDCTTANPVSIYSFLPLLTGPWGLSLAPL